MAFTQSIPLRTPLFRSRYSRFRTTNLNVFPKIPVRSPRISLPILYSSCPKPSVPTTEEDILKVVAELEEENTKSVPAVRTYENELACLTLVGAVSFRQALTAAAADGGEAAEEHIDAGMPALVAETLYPGLSDENSTVSTRLYLPATEVKEKAKHLKRTGEIMGGTPPKNILAMTFRQVVLEQLWKFEMVLFIPGTERNMKNLDRPREVPPSFTFSSSDERLISVLAEVVSLCVFKSTESHFQDNKGSNNLFNFFRKPDMIISKDSSIIIYKLLEDEVPRNAKSLVEKFKVENANYKSTGMNLKYKWWAESAFSKLAKIGGPEFSAWVSEYVPAYRLQIDSNKFSNITFKGWKHTSENLREVLLTHSQMVGLANVLDMYYEDLYTLPYKQLSCGEIRKSTNLSINKRSSSLSKILSTILVSGIILVTISIMGKLWLPHLSNGRKYHREEYRSLQSSDTEYIHQQSVDPLKLEAFAISIVSKVKDAFGWPEETVVKSGFGAWTGELPDYVRRIVEADNSGFSSEKSDAEMKAWVQDIASYQVVLSGEGKIVGIQPTSRAAVNNWSANPLVRELFGGKKLSPGFMEPGIKINRPSEVAVLELLMSVNPDFYFALARPARLC